MLYTIGATFWLFAFLDRPLPKLLTWLFSLLGRHSYFVYLVHPFFMYYAMEWLGDASLELTPERIPLFFLWAAGGSLFAAIIFRFLSRFIPGLSWILTGSGTR
jgi:peptidoglycan/LPS O-acetylase OafA/YrhL